MTENADPGSPAWEQARSVHEAGSDAAGWQPIENAPRDGTPIVAWCVHPYASRKGRIRAHLGRPDRARPALARQMTRPGLLSDRRFWIGFVGMTALAYGVPAVMAWWGARG